MEKNETEDFKKFEKKTNLVFGVVGLILILGFIYLTWFFNRIAYSYEQIKISWSQVFSYYYPRFEEIEEIEARLESEENIEAVKKFREDYQVNSRVVAVNEMEEIFAESLEPCDDELNLVIENFNQVIDSHNDRLQKFPGKYLRLIYGWEEEEKIRISNDKN